MKNRSRPTQAKRAREKALIEKRERKAARRVEAKERLASGIRMEDMEDEVDPRFVVLPTDNMDLIPARDKEEPPSEA
jgi:hypothetical protein